jgi:hypothetical protein
LRKDGSKNGKEGKKGKKGFFAFFALLALFASSLITTPGQLIGRNGQTAAIGL